MALLPLVEMGTAPPIVRGMTCFGQLIDFLTAHVYSDNCSCPIEEHSQTIALIGLSYGCKRTEWSALKDSGLVRVPAWPAFTDGEAAQAHRVPMERSKLWSI